MLLDDALDGERRCDRIAVLAAFVQAGLQIFKGTPFPCGTVLTDEGRQHLVWFATEEDCADAHRLVAVLKERASDTARQA